MKNNSFESISLIIMFFLIVFLIVMKYVNPNSGSYVLTHEGVNYICKEKQELLGKIENTNPYILYKEKDLLKNSISISKEKFYTREDAYESCKQDEIFVLSDTGEVNLYQSARTDCTYIDEDDNYYYFYPGYTYILSDCTIEE